MAHWRPHPVPQHEPEYGQEAGVDFHVHRLALQRTIHHGLRHTGSENRVGLHLRQVQQKGQILNYLIHWQHFSQHTLEIGLCCLF